MAFGLLATEFEKKNCKKDLLNIGSPLKDKSIHSMLKQRQKVTSNLVQKSLLLLVFRGVVQSMIMKWTPKSFKNLLQGKKLRKMATGTFGTMRGRKIQSDELALWGPIQKHKVTPILCSFHLKIKGNYNDLARFFQGFEIPTLFSVRNSWKKNAEISELWKDYAHPIFSH